jgi:hypothetical protein
VGTQCQRVRESQRAGQAAAGPRGWAGRERERGRARAGRSAGPDRREEEIGPVRIFVFVFFFK